VWKCQAAVELEEFRAGWSRSGASRPVPPLAAHSPPACAAASADALAKARRLRATPRPLRHGRSASRLLVIARPPGVSRSLCGCPRPDARESQAHPCAFLALPSRSRARGRFFARACSSADAMQGRALDPQACCRAARSSPTQRQSSQPLRSTTLPSHGMPVILATGDPCCVLASSTLAISGPARARPHCAAQTEAQEELRCPLLTLQSPDPGRQCPLLYMLGQTAFSFASKGMHRVQRGARD